MSKLLIRVKSFLGLNHLWLACALILAPLAATLAEPRTFPFEGYLPDPRSASAFGAVIVLGLLTGFGLGDYEKPLAKPTLWVTGLLSVAGLVTGATPLAWTLTLVSLAIASLLSVVSLRFPKVAIASKRALAAGLGVGSLALADFIHSQVLTGIDFRPLGAFLMSHLFPMIAAPGDLPGISVSGDSHTMVIHLALDRMGGIYLVALTLFMLFASGWKRRSWLSVGGDLAAILIYAYVAALVTISRNIGMDEQNWFVDFAWPVIYLPLAIWLSFRIAGGGREVKDTGPKLRFAWLLPLVGAMLFVSGWSLWGPYNPRHGKVVMDEAHGAWETARVPLNDSDFGAFSVYNYWSLFQELHSRYGAELTEHELSSKELQDVSVLILKTPTKPLSDQYCDAVVDYVHKGGGLWIIGDHTDAFGMTTYLNKLATRLGLSFEKNAWFEPPVKRNLWAPDTFTDPVARKIPPFLFYTGCEVHLQPFDKKLMVARRNIFEGADYSAPSFFGALRTVPENNGGNVTMAALCQRDQGRVAVWTDSTLFSNFAIYTPGKLDIALNTVTWLGNSNAVPIFRPALMLLGGVLFIVGVFFAGGLTSMLALIASLALAPLLMSVFSHPPVCDPLGIVPDNSFAFYDPVKSPHLPVYVSLDKAESYGYFSSLVAAQRLGKRPYVAQTIPELRKAKVVVVIPSISEIPVESIAYLASWVKSGGRLVVLDGGNDAGRFATLLFSKAGLPSPYPPETAKTTEQHIEDMKGHSMGDAQTVTVTGGNLPMARIHESGETIGEWFSVGKGKVFVSGTANAFSDQACSYVLDLPTEKQFATLSVLFDIYREADR